MPPSTKCEGRGGVSAPAAATATPHTVPCTEAPTPVDSPMQGGRPPGHGRRSVLELALAELIRFWEREDGLDDVAC